MEILGVAIKYNKLVICLPKPNRHCNVFWYATDVLGLDKKLVGQGKNQGFYTDNGIFLNRVEAYKVAKIKNQIINPDEKEGILFSENVW